MRNVSERIPSFTVTLEEAPGKGKSLPIPDVKITNYFVKNAKTYPGHIVFAAFFSVLFNQLLVYIMDVDTFPGSHTIPMADVTKSHAEIVEKPNLWLHQYDEQIHNFRGQYSLEGVCKKLYSFRRVNKGAARRETLLHSVTTLAEAILASQKDVLSNHDSQYVEPEEKKKKAAEIAKKEREARDYLHTTGLVKNLKRFYHLLDNSSGDTEYENSSLGRPVQFILGIDECGFL